MQSTLLAFGGFWLIGYKPLQGYWNVIVLYQSFISGKP